MEGFGSSPRHRAGASTREASSCKSLAMCKSGTALHGLQASPALTSFFADRVAFVKAFLLLRGTNDHWDPAPWRQSRGFGCCCFVQGEVRAQARCWENPTSRELGSVSLRMLRDVQSCNDGLLQTWPRSKLRVGCQLLLKTCTALLPQEASG